MRGGNWMFTLIKLACMILIACLAVLYKVQVPVIVCDYQLELKLISYNHSTGRLQNGRCCDSRKNNDIHAPCSLQDTCDVRFEFLVQNFMRTVSNRYFGIYDNSDIITFANCSTLINSYVQHPLTFTIPTNKWNEGVS